MNREPLSNADFAVLRLGSPENLMIITALMTLETRLKAAQLETILERTLAHHKRFRQRLVLPRSPLLKAYWVEDKSFDIKRHIHCIHTPLPDEPKLLEDLVSRLLSVDLDYSKPLWQFYLVKCYGNGSALIWRLHHSIADGTSVVKIILSMTQDKPDDPMVDAVRLAYQQASIHKPGKNGKNQGTRKFLSKLAGIGKAAINDAEALEDLVRVSSSTAVAAGQLLFSSPDSKNVFRGPIGISKQAAWSPALSLEQVKFVSKAFNSSINDVLLSAITGALRRYILEIDQDFDFSMMHSLIPIDMRRPTRIAQAGLLMDEIIDLSNGNHVGAALLQLPLHIDNPLDRLAIIHKSMDSLKASGEGLVTYWFMSALGALPAEVQELATNFWLTKSSTVITNVVGPSKQLYLGSAAIGTMIGWVPQFGPVGLGISIFSYNGKIWIGVAVDQGLIPDPGKLVSYFLEELRLLGTQAVQLEKPA